VRILKDLDINIEGRHVLVVEDIIDSGLTLSYLMRNLEAAGARVARGLRAAGRSRTRARSTCAVRYTGFEIPNRFVIGYGLDFAERTGTYRTSAYSTNRWCSDGT
jgi:hypoxanthine phosphoribosyltransferase